ncbi:MAG: uracil-DNA glycosylase family protein [Vulcanimicrobiota bacterium]
MTELESVVREASVCRHCAEWMPHEPRPVFQVSETCKLLIVGQAPGRRVQQSGKPWDDPSGDRLREWLGLSEAEFYDPALVGHLPIGFCYPGHGPHGDLPPRKECAPLWHPRLLPLLKSVRLLVLVGGYAQAYYLGRGAGVSERVRKWKESLPRYLPLPHPSPRNNIWLGRHPWFAHEVLPEVRATVRDLVES